MTSQRLLLMWIVATLWSIYAVGWLATLKVNVMVILSVVALHLVSRELKAWTERGRRCSHCGEHGVHYDSSLGSDFCRLCRRAA